MHAGQLHRLARQLREIALVATGNTGTDRVSAGELLVIEDVSAHPESSIREITERTQLAQSLVSRIVATMREHDILVSTPDPDDGRKTRISVDPKARSGIFRDRARRPVEPALAESLPHLKPSQVKRLHRLLDEVFDLLHGG